MNPLLVFGLGAAAGIGLSSYGRPLLVRLFRAGMVTAGYAKTAGSYAAGKVQGVARRASSPEPGLPVPAPPTPARRRPKSAAKRETKPGVRTAEKKTRTAKKKTAPPTPEPAS